MPMYLFYIHYWEQHCVRLQCNKLLKNDLFIILTNNAVQETEMVSKYNMSNGDIRCAK